MRFYTLKPVFETSNILFFLCVKPRHSHFILWIYSRILQIDHKEADARSLLVFRLREKKKEPEITLVP